MKNSSRFLSRARHYIAQEAASTLQTSGCKGQGGDRIVFKPSSVFSRARHDFGTEGQACSSQFAMSPSGCFAQAAISWGSKMTFTIPWQAPASSSGRTLAGHCWELGDYLEEILLWAFFIHILLLRHWLPGMGLEDWQSWYWAGGLLCWELRSFWWGRIQPWHTLSPGRCWVLPRPTA